MEPDCAVFLLEPDYPNCNLVLNWIGPGLTLYRLGYIIYPCEKHFHFSLNLFKKILYEDRLTKLGIKSLEYRRLEFDLILMYKISHNLSDLNFSNYFVFQTCAYNLRRHDFTVQSLFHNASPDQFSSILLQSYS